MGYGGFGTDVCASLAGKAVAIQCEREAQRSELPREGPGAWRALRPGPQSQGKMTKADYNSGAGGEGFRRWNQQDLVTDWIWRLGEGITQGDFAGPTWGNWEA